MDPTPATSNAGALPGGAPIALYAGIILFAVARFAARELKERKVSLARIFVAPAFLALLAAFLLWFSFTRFAATETLLAGETLITLGLGCAVGLAVGHFTTIRLGEKPGFIYVLGNWKTIAIWVGHWRCASARASHSGNTTSARRLQRTPRSS